LNFPFTSNTNPTQAGALLQFDSRITGRVVTARFGVSMKSSAQACTNAENEIGDDWDFDDIRESSREKWEGVLERVEIDTHKEDPTIVELLYSSVRAVFTISDFLG
jgi:putative alpha-1,2-mannosidase